MGYHISKPVYRVESQYNEGYHINLIVLLHTSAMEARPNTNIIWCYWCINYKLDNKPTLG